MKRLGTNINKFMDALYEHSEPKSWKNIILQMESFTDDMMSDTPGQTDSEVDVIPPAISMDSWNSYKNNNNKKNKSKKTSTTGIDTKTGYEDPLKGYPYN